MNKLNNNKLEDSPIDNQDTIRNNSTNHNVRILIMLVDSQTNIMYLVMLI